MDEKLELEVQKEKEETFKGYDTALLRSIVPSNVTTSEVKLFLYLCEQYHLDPFKKEIYLIKYHDKASIITSRDGYLKIANTDPQFDGLESDCIYQEDILTRREDGSICITYGQPHLKFDKTQLMGAFANVYRKDRAKASTVFVSMQDYKKSSKIWDQYPNSMILKVAESMALKRAFTISGLVTKEEVEE